MHGHSRVGSAVSRMTEQVARTGSEQSRADANRAESFVREGI
jgi:hypothetical protein